MAVSIEMDVVKFPPLTLEIGNVMSFEVEDTTHTTQLNDAGAARMGIVTGTRNIKSDFSAKDANYCGSPDPEFYESGGEILSRQDPNFNSLRGIAHQNNMQIVQAICGTPYHNPGTPLWPLNTTYYTEEFKPYGKYALPIESKFNDYAGVVAEWMMDAESASGFPSIWIGNQEPDHTAGFINSEPTDEGKLTNIKRYIRCWTPLARKVRALNRDAMVGGIQQNAVAGTTGETGDRYIEATNYFLEYEKSLGGTTPIDYFTIQNYKGEKNEQILHNFNYAMTHAKNGYAVTDAEVTARYQKTPVLMNRYGYDKKLNAEANFNTSDGIIRLLKYHHVLINQPDLYSCSMKTSKLATPSYMSYKVGAFLNKMPTERRPINIPESGMGGFASGNALGVYAVLWNTGANPHDITLELNDLPSAEWLNYTLEVLKGDGTHCDVISAILTKTGTDDYRIDGFSLGKDTFALIRLDAGDSYLKSIDRNDLDQLVYSRMDHYCNRTAGSAVTPSGSGHYDVRTGQLIVGADNSKAVGLAGVTFREVQPERQIDVDFTLENLPATGDNSTILEVRIDYLNGDTTMKTVFIAPDKYVHAGTAFWEYLDWKPIGTTISTFSQTIDPDVRITFNIEKNAPSKWASAPDKDRGLMISLLLTNAPNTSMVRARLSDRIPAVSPHLHK